MPLPPQPAEVATEPSVTLTDKLWIEDAPGGKLFQGVWIGEGEWKVVVDYRANEIWRPFENLEVRATGKRWHPDRDVQAINATHFTVERLEVADRAQARRFFALGPERECHGKLVTVAGEPGSKSEGSTILYFNADGRRYEVAGGAAPDAVPAGEVTALVRDVEINPAWAATRGGPFVWILRVR
jgi:hypothetical protein